MEINSVAPVQTPTTVLDTTQNPEDKQGKNVVNTSEGMSPAKSMSKDDPRALLALEAEHHGAHRARKERAGEKPTLPAGDKRARREFKADIRQFDRE